MGALPSGLTAGSPCPLFRSRGPGCGGGWEAAVGAEGGRGASCKLQALMADDPREHSVLPLSADTTITPENFRTHRFLSPPLFCCSDASPGQLVIPSKAGWKLQGSLNSVSAFLKSLR